MLENNVRSFIIHILVDFICLLAFEIQDEFIGYRVNILGNDSKSYVSLQLLFAIVVFILSMLLYYFLSRRYLTKFSMKKNIISVLFVAIAGILLWLLSYILYPQAKGMNGGFLKLYYQMYNANCLPLFSALNIENSYLAGIFAIVPSLSMWIGIQSKGSNKK